MHRHKRRAGFDQPPGHQHPLTGRVAAVLVAELLRLLGDVERFAGLLGTDQRVSSLVERINRVEGFGLLAGGKVIVDRTQDRTTAVETLVVHTTGKLQVLDGETAAGRVGSQAERSKGTGKVAGTGITVRLAGDAHVGRQVVPRPKLVRHHRTDTRELQRGAGTVPGKHVVSAPLVGSFAVRVRVHNGDLVGDLSRILQGLVEPTTGHLRSDRTHRAAVLQRSVRLRVPSLLVGLATREEDEDHRFRGAFLALEKLLVRLGFLCAKQVSHREAESAEVTGIKEVTPRRFVSHQFISLKYPATRVVLTLSLFGYRMFCSSSKCSLPALSKQADHQAASF